MGKVKTSRDTKNIRNLKMRPTTLTDIKFMQMPARTVRNIRGTHMVRGIRDISRIGKQYWEDEVADAMRMVDKQRFYKATRIYILLDRVKAALAEAEKQRQKAQTAYEEMQASNEELRVINEELQSTQEELRTASAYTRSLIEANLDPLVTISPQGKITDVNEATVKVTGVPREKLIGTDFSDYFTKPEKARVGYKRALKKGLLRDYPLELRQKKGRAIPVLYNASVYRDEKGKLVGVFAAARDITELKRAQEKVQTANEELQAANEELQASNEEIQASMEELQVTTEELKRTSEQMQQFALVASHELQEPLRMVASYLQLIEQRYKSKLDKKGREFMAFAVDGAERMQALVNDLLTYSRVTTQGKAFKPTNCEDVLKEVLSNMQVTVKKARAKVTHDPLPGVMADGLQLSQLLQNLIGNAVKFRKKKVLPCVHIAAKKEKNAWVFSIRDNGIGIAPEHQERIFQIFQRLAPKGVYPGTGIGLAICKNIVERHGGRIWVKSQAGKGATFYFTIPVTKVERRK